MRRSPVVRAALLAAALLLAPALGAQQPSDARLRQQREELERIRRERSELEARMRQLQSNVHDVAEEVANIERQADATQRAVSTLDQQLASIGDEVGSATERLVRAEDELVVKQAILRRRLSDIYKRGPLYTVEALLSAESFGELVARYKYLHMLALRDRALVARVAALRDQIGGERTRLVRLQNDLEGSRRERADEAGRLVELERQRAASLAALRRSARQTQARLARIARDEARLGDVIANLEAARRRAAARRPATSRPAPESGTRRGSNALDWPVRGELLYSFGRVVNPNNTTTRWNGIGIAAAAGTTVRAVAAGEVMVAEPFGTYGLTVIVQHPGGDYSVYGSLGSADVRKGAIVNRGQAIGTVGSADPELPPHLHFEMRPGGRAADPLEWLKDQD
jgi:septal ring factor EnvC (AmiA/AmiB activator)